MSESWYQRAKRLGINMSWYERVKATTGDAEAPLDDKQCSDGSIYLLKKNGSLWTINSVGEAHRQVREAVKPIERPIFVCVCCKAQSDSAEGLTHKQPVDNSK